jgi:phosphoglucomutase
MTIKYIGTVKQLQETATHLREKAKSVEYSTLPEQCRSVLTANADLFDLAAFQLAKADSFIDMLQAVNVEEWQAIRERKIIVVAEWQNDASDARFRFITKGSLGSDYITLEQRKQECPGGGYYWKKNTKLKKIKAALNLLINDLAKEQS